MGKDIIRGQKSPILLNFMINKQNIETFIKEHFTENNLNFYLVDIEISRDKKIFIYFDSLEGINISDCVSLSREINKGFSPDIENYELQVSSPGIGEPFKVFEQYKKAISKNVEVLLSDGNKIKGQLLDANSENIIVSVTIKTKDEKTKKKIELQENKEINYNNIKTTKLVIAFK